MDEVGVSCCRKEVDFLKASIFVKVFSYTFLYFFCFKYLFCYGGCTCGLQECRGGGNVDVKVKEKRYRWKGKECTNVVKRIAGTLTFIETRVCPRRTKAA